MTKRSFYILCAAGASLALLLGAFAFQYLGGMAPCKLCLWQRWPHAAAVVIGLIALRVPGSALPLLGALAALSTAAIGAYHTGVERGWWQGPTSCTGNGSLSGLSGSDLLSTENVEPIVMCDQVPWEMFTLSMASWNAIASLGMVLIWLMAARSKG